MVIGLHLSAQSLPLDGTPAESQPVDSETLQPVSFAELLKVKEKQLQQEQVVGAASIAAALAAMQTSIVMIAPETTTGSGTNVPSAQPDIVPPMTSSLMQDREVATIESDSARPQLDASTPRDETSHPPSSSPTNRLPPTDLPAPVPATVSNAQTETDPQQSTVQPEFPETKTTPIVTVAQSQNSEPPFTPTARPAAVTPKPGMDTRASPPSPATPTLEPSQAAEVEVATISTVVDVPKSPATVTVAAEAKANSETDKITLHPVSQVETSSVAKTISSAPNIEPSNAAPVQDTRPQPATDDGTNSAPRQEPKSVTPTEESTRDPKGSVASLPPSEKETGDRPVAKLTAAETDAPAVEHAQPQAPPLPDQANEVRRSNQTVEMKATETKTDANPNRVAWTQVAEKTVPTAEPQETIAPTTLPTSGGTKSVTEKEGQQPVEMIEPETVHSTETLASRPATNPEFTHPDHRVVEAKTEQAAEPVSVSHIAVEPIGNNEADDGVKPPPEQPHETSATVSSGNRPEAGNVNPQADLQAGAVTIPSTQATSENVPATNIQDVEAKSVPVGQPVKPGIVSFVQPGEVVADVETVGKPIASARQVISLESRTEEAAPSFVARPEKAIVNSARTASRAAVDPVDAVRETTETVERQPAASMAVGASARFAAVDVDPPADLPTVIDAPNNAEMRTLTQSESPVADSRVSPQPVAPNDDKSAADAKSTPPQAGKVAVVTEEAWSVRDVAAIDVDAVAEPVSPEAMTAKPQTLDHADVEAKTLVSSPDETEIAAGGMKTTTAPSQPEIKPDEKVEAKPFVSTEEPARPVEKESKAGRTPEVVAATTSVGKEAVIESGGKMSAVSQVNIPAAEVIQQVIRQLNGRLKSGAASMRLQLNPKELGAIDVEMVSGPRGVQVTFFAEQAGTGKLLEAGLNHLRDSLVDSGVQLSGLNISQHNSSGQKGGDFNQETVLARHPEREAAPTETRQEPVRAERIIGQTSEVDYRI